MNNLKDKLENLQLSKQMAKFEEIKNRYEQLEHQKIQYEQMKQKAEHDLNIEINKNCLKEGLPETPFIVRQIANYMLQGVSCGDACKAVRADIDGFLIDTNQYLKRQKKKQFDSEMKEILDEKI
jgi:hypothetical protein